MLARALDAGVPATWVTADAGGEGEEAVVDVGATFPSFGEASELVRKGEGLFDDPGSRAAMVSSAW